MVDIAFPTVDGIVTKVQNLIGEVSGSGVQTYTEDFVRQFVIDAFNFVFLKQVWPQYRRFDTVTFAGVTGKSVEANPFGDISGGIENFIGVFRENENTPMPLLPARIGNPNVLTGSRAIYWSALPASDTDFLKKRIRVWPTTAVTTLNTVVRLHPGAIVGGTTLYMDELMLKLGAAWLMLDDEGTNPAGAAKYKEMFDQRFQDIITAMGEHPIHIAGRHGPVTEWMER